MSESTLIIVLALFTLLAVVVWGGSQYLKAQRAKKNHEHSAFAHKPNDRES